MKTKSLKIIKVLFCILLIGLILIFIKFRIDPSHINSGKQEQFNKVVSSTKNEVDKYDYSKAVPLSKKVDVDYFKDAVFFGDSLTYGMTVNFPINKDNVIACKGATIDDMMQSVILSGKEEKGYTNALKEVKKRNPKKIYIMLGTNGFAWRPKEKIISDYEKLISKIISDNPQSKIYIQSIFPISKNKEISDERYNNEKITQINSLLLTLSKNKMIYYLDTNSVLKDNEGYLSKEYTNSTDGIHVNSDAYKLWFNYLCEHTV